VVALVALVQQPVTAQTANPVVEPLPSVAHPGETPPVPVAPSNELAPSAAIGPVLPLQTIAGPVEEDEESPIGKFLGPWNPDRWFRPLERLPLSMAGFAVVDSWRGLPDGHFQNNNGFKKGANVGGLLPGLADWGIGAQLGASYGLYHTTGRASATDAVGEFQQQTFVTAGLFRRATDDVPLAAGIVYDAMINDSYGVYAQSPYLSQIRMQLGYMVCESDELGFWMTQHGPGTTHYPDGIATSWRAISQYNMFWHHNYKSTSADVWMWIGLPNHHRLDGDGSLGQLIFGSSGSVPLSAHTVLYASTSYMMPSSHPSVAGSIEDTFYVGFGLAHFIGPKARHKNVAGNPNDPYLTVADNANFFVDTTRTF
jgi:hypothetical protein